MTTRCPPFFYTILDLVGQYAMPCYSKFYYYDCLLLRSGRPQWLWDMLLSHALGLPQKKTRLFLFSDIFLRVTADSKITVIELGVKTSCMVFTRPWPLSHVCSTKMILFTSRDEIVVACVTQRMTKVFRLDAQRINQNLAKTSDKRCDQHGLSK